MTNPDFTTELNSHVYLEDHPKFGLALWHKTVQGEFDRHIELNDAAEERLLELLLARQAARKASV
jgi:hypothetical protein